MSKRRTVTIPIEMYEGLKKFEPLDRVKIYDSLFQTLFEGKPPDKNLTPAQYMAYVVYAPQLRKIQQVFLNGSCPKVFSRASNESEKQANRSENQADRSKSERDIYNNINNNNLLNKQTINQTNVNIINNDELERRKFYVEAALKKADETFGIDDRASFNLLQKVLARVQNEKTNFNIGGVEVSPTEWLERFLDVFRHNKDEIYDILETSDLASPGNVTNKYRYWIAKTYNKLSEF